MARTKVNITVDNGLLAKVDEYAKDNFTTRSGVFSQGAAGLVNTSILLHAAQDMAVALRKIADEGKVDNETVSELEDVARALQLLIGKL